LSESAKLILDLFVDATFVEDENKFGTIDSVDDAEADDDADGADAAADDEDAN
jgi:hypothetical protein